MTIALDAQQTEARAWFESLRDRICAAFETIEREAGSDAAFDYIEWDRVDPSGEPGGGGVRGVMKGRVFEKVGVNVSTVGGTFEGEFGKTVHGATDDPRFFATGISLVAHLANPHAPAVHMNCRLLRTTKQWFGGGADLNPPLPVAEDTADFHAALKAACDRHDPAYHPRFKQWADDYFYIPHRQVHRGVGGIFYDHLEGDFDAGIEMAVAAVGILQERLCLGGMGSSPREVANWLWEHNAGRRLRDVHDRLA